MVDLTRRWFILGTAAAVAVAAAPIFTAEVERVAAVHAYKKRLIYGFMVGFDHDGIDEVASVSLRRIESDYPLHQVMMNVRGFYRWCAVPGSEILALPSHPIIFDIQSNTSVGKIIIECEDKTDDGRSVHVAEFYEFKDGKQISARSEFMEI